MLVNRRVLRVEWGQCDPAGIVFYPQYLIMFDNGTAALFERTGLSSQEMREKHAVAGMPLVEIGVRFSIPSRFGDDLTAESWVSEWGRASFTVQHRLLKSGQLAVEGFEKRVWVGAHPERPGDIKAKPIPRDIVASLSDPTGATRCS